MSQNPCKSSAVTAAVRINTWTQRDNESHQSELSEQRLVLTFWTRSFLTVFDQTGKLFESLINQQVSQSDR